MASAFAQKKRAAYGCGRSGLAACPAARPCPAAAARIGRLAGVAAGGATAAGATASVVGSDLALSSAPEHDERENRRLGRARHPRAVASRASAARPPESRPTSFRRGGRRDAACARRRRRAGHGRSWRPLMSCFLAGSKRRSSRQREREARAALVRGGACELGAPGWIIDCSRPVLGTRFLPTFSEKSPKFWVPTAT